MQRGRNVEAAAIKKYVDLLFRVHRRYAEEVKKNEELVPQIGIAENKLRIALELTANSEETMQHLKEALGETRYDYTITNLYIFNKISPRLYLTT